MAPFVRVFGKHAAKRKCSYLDQNARHDTVSVCLWTDLDRSRGCWKGYCYTNDTSIFVILRATAALSAPGLCLQIPVHMFIKPLLAAEQKTFTCYPTVEAKNPSQFNLQNPLLPQPFKEQVCLIHRL